MAAKKGQKETLKSKVHAKLLQRGVCSKALIKKGTKMTREEWKKYQGEKMDAKWPLPEYMGGQKGHTCYREETYSTVLRWAEATRIQYRPHAKAPGSKSHVRYEVYSKAKTVGEALSLGSYPADWCWDWERGFIRVLGGEREEPLDLAKAQTEGRRIPITDVDRAIDAWYKRELSRELGVPVSELSFSVPWGESLRMRGLRLVAQKEAKERLEKADRTGRCISDEDLLAVLKRWSFFRNPWRKNVMHKGQEWVYSDTLGLLRDRQGDVHITAATRRYPQVAELIGRWLTERLPKEAKQFKFTSLNLNCNYAAAQHRDNGNFGPSFIKALGDFSGGELNYWPEDAGGKLQALPKKAPVKFDIQKGVALFNGNCAHSVDSFTGARYSVVWFTVGCHGAAHPEDKAKLCLLGFPYPGKNEDPYALLKVPKGRKSRSTSGAGTKQRPAYRYWSVRKLKTKRAGKCKDKKRLEPENAHSFYNSDARKQKRRSTGSKRPRTTKA